MSLSYRAKIDPHKLAVLTGLSHGAHGSEYQSADRKVANKEVCIMEAVSYVCNLSWSDGPICVDEWLTRWSIWYNDSEISEEQRNKLIPLIPKLVNTKYHDDATKLEQRRLAFHRTLDLLVVPWLRWNGPSENSWFTDTILPESDTEKRVELLQNRMRAIRLIGYVEELYRNLCNWWSTFKEWGAGGYLDMLPFHLLKTIDGAYDTILSILNDVLDVRDVASEEAAMNAEVKAQDERAAHIATLIEKSLLVEEVAVS